ncbi:SpoIID/LytB domain-containing protein [Prevotella sp.]|uniref:SpoIID/LytB domain-containing protein n=1 Tax=Prevotella sp. TaxID=59823 RepID=UPI002F93F9D8
MQKTINGDSPKQSLTVSKFFANEPTVSVGIVSGQTIRFILNQPYFFNEKLLTGEQTVTLSEDRKIEWNGSLYTDLLFTPSDRHSSFSLTDVTIGVNFHWQRKETQTFTGRLHLIIDHDKIFAVNELPVEDYLESVISSEMSATSSLELLKAHAVISRSWLLAQMAKRTQIDEGHVQSASCIQDNERLIRWYDREDHTLFDVCADDHCQRYQGITKETSPHVAQAIAATRGRILTYENEICDARFSKSCGGMVEEFQYCWENIRKPYLAKLRDLTPCEPSQPDLTIETNAEEWIRTAPKAFCNTTDKHILSQVLNDYDQETTDFYRWTVDYTQDELRRLILEKLGIDFGEITDLIPVERGVSGRLCQLKIVGTLKTLIIGKELEIRRTLSPTHLYSSAFVIDKFDVNNGIPQRFRLTGAGWGHGVGLCQIGAAVMGEKGFLYDEILLHYYPGAAIEEAYS